MKHRLCLAIASAAVMISCISCAPTERPEETGSLPGTDPHMQTEETVPPVVTETATVSADTVDTSIETMYVDGELVVLYPIFMITENSIVFDALPEGEYIKMSNSIHGSEYSAIVCESGRIFIACRERGAPPENEWYGEIPVIIPWEYDSFDILYFYDDSSAFTIYYEFHNGDSSWYALCGASFEHTDKVNYQPLDGKTIRMHLPDEYETDWLDKLKAENPPGRPLIDEIEYTLNPEHIRTE